MHHLTRLSLAYPKCAIAILLAVSALLGAGLPKVRSEFGYRVLVGDDYPAIQALDALIEQFGGGLPVQIAWECSNGAPCQQVFDQASLRMAHAITGELAAAEGVRSVLGPANAPLLVPRDDGFAVRRFVEQGQLAADAAELGQRALRDALWVGKVVSRDGRVGVVTVQPADTRPATDVLVVDAIQATLAPFEAQGFSFHIAGDAAEAYLGGVDLAESNARLVPLAIVVMSAMLYALTRSWSKTFAVLASMGVTLLWTFGLLGWLGWPRDGILEVLAALLLVVGVCDSMHLLACLSDSAEREPPGAEDPESLAARQRRLSQVARDVSGACTFATLTDAGAFLSFATSSLDTFVRFGVTSAFGVLAALVLSFSLLPLLLCAVRHRSGQPHTGVRWSRVLEQIVRISELHHRRILAAGALALVVFTYGWVAFLRVDTDWLESWGDRSDRTRAIRFLEERLGQLKTIEIQVALPEGTPIEDPQALAAVQQLEAALARESEISGTSSVLDLVTRANRLLHGDDPAFERMPATLGASAEILELLALDDESVLSPWLSLDRSQLRLSVESREFPFRQGERLVETVRQISSEALPRTWQVNLTGEIPITVDWVRDVQATQLQGFPMAVLTVYVLIAAFLRSLRLALAALLPTLLPIVITLGSMGLLGLCLDVGRAMIGSVVIGIGVDDAIHLLSRYRASRRAGRLVRDAMVEAMQHSGRAIVTNSLTLSLGFLTLMASAWQSISSFGFFVALAILGALVSTLVVMPALIFAFARSSDA